MRTLAATIIVVSYFLVSLGVSFVMYENKGSIGAGDRDLTTGERVALVAASLGWPMIVGIRIAEKLVIEEG